MRPRSEADQKDRDLRHSWIAQHRGVGPIDAGNIISLYNHDVFVKKWEPPRGQRWASLPRVKPAISGETGYPTPAIITKEKAMKIKVDKALVEFEPQTDEETAAMQKLWDLIVDCVKENKKLVPVGEFVPVKRNLARFAIER